MANMQIILSGFKHEHTGRTVKLAKQRKNDYHQTPWKSQ